MLFLIAECQTVNEKGNSPFGNYYDCYFRSETSKTTKTIEVNGVKNGIFKSCYSIPTQDTYYLQK